MHPTVLRLHTAENRSAAPLGEPEERAIGASFYFVGFDWIGSETGVVA